jgi:hypothetical protein
MLKFKPQNPLDENLAAQWFSIGASLTENGGLVNGFPEL